MSNQLLVMVPDSDNSIHKDVLNLRAEIGRQADILRSHDGVAETGRPHFASAHSFEPLGPVSPRQQAFDPARRPSLQPASRTSSFRTPMPPHLTVSPRRYGSMSGPSGPTASPTPSSVRPPPPPTYSLPPPPPVPPGPAQAQPQQQAQQPQPQQQHLLTAGGNSPPMNLLRRHTSADIRLQGWNGTGAPPLPGTNQGGSPYASGQNSAHRPSSPYRLPVNPEDQQLRNALAQYELPRANSHMNTRQVTPPPDQGVPSYGNPNNDGWQLPGPKFPFKGVEASAPPTRRSSMASNVHSLLNPTETAHREVDDEGPEERKRKRIS